MLFNIQIYIYRIVYLYINYIIYVYILSSYKFFITSVYIEYMYNCINIFEYMYSIINYSAFQLDSTESRCQEETLNEKLRMKYVQKWVNISLRFIIFFFYQFRAYRYSQRFETKTSGLGFLKASASLVTCNSIFSTRIIYNFCQRSSFMLMLLSNTDTYNEIFCYRYVRRLLGAKFLSDRACARVPSTWTTARGCARITPRNS